MMMAAVLANAGLTDSAVSVIQRARARESKSPFLAYYEAWARMNLGQRDTAILRLSDFLAARPGLRARVAGDWLWEPLADEPGFEALVADSAAPPRS